MRLARLTSGFDSAIFVLLLAGAACLAGGGEARASMLELDRKPVQGGLIVGRTEPGTRIELDGRRVRVSDDGLFLIGFGRNAPPKARLVAVFADGSRENSNLPVARRTYKVQRIDGLPPRKVTPTEEDMVRIRKETALVKTARLRDDPRTDFRDGFQWPLKGRISGIYGSQRILNNEPRRPHVGVDIVAPTGAIVRAPADGVVTLVHDDMFFSGGTLFVDHGHGLSSSFLHLNAILVTEGARVRRGQPIAEVGATGRASGPHLHWGMNLFNRRLDPQLLVDPMNE